MTGRGREGEENNAVSLISFVVSHRHAAKESPALLSRCATKGQVSFNYRKSNEHGRAEEGRSCASTIIVEIGENVGERAARRGAGG